MKQQPTTETAEPKAAPLTSRLAAVREKTSPKKMILFGVAFVLFLLVTNPTLIPFLNAQTRETLGNTWQNLFGDIGSISSTFTFNWVAAFKLIAMALLLGLIGSIIRFVLDRVHPKSGKARSAVTLMQSALSYCVTLVGLFWALSILGVGVGTILASVGIITLIVGFGAEHLVADLVSGLFLVFENQFNVGDIIEVGGYRGTVETIGVRTTAIRDTGGNVKLINNADIRNVLNRSSAVSVASITVSISYDEKIERVEKVLEKVLPAIREKHPDIFLSDPRYVGVQELGASSVDLKVIAQVDESNIFSAPRILNREIKLAFDEAHIEIPFPQLVIHNGDKA